ncbi:hypothetical protein KAU33_14805 [Candidatus Dependentiae bacterium]|nr:hypothetical protein [Candidatus Dependentiae bacterium]
MKQLGKCSFTSIHNGKSNNSLRHLDEFPILIRYNNALDIIHKIRNKSNSFLSEMVSSINLFGFESSYRGSSKKGDNSIALLSSKGKGFMDFNISSAQELIGKYKVVISRTISEHAGEHGKDGKFKVLAKTMILSKNEICSHSYLVIGTFDNKKEALFLENYLRTKFVRFLILQTISGIDLSKERFMFVPLQDFSQPWTDEKLYKKYDLTIEEKDYIESMIRSME